MDDGYRLGGIKERRKKKLNEKKKHFPLRNVCLLLGGRSYSVCRTCTKKRKPGTKRKSRAFSRHASTRLNKRNRKSSVHRGELVARGQPREPPRGPKSKGTSMSKTTKKANGTINKAKSKFPIQPHKCATRSSREGGGFI